VSLTLTLPSLDHDIKDSEARIKEDNEVNHDVYNRNTNTNRFKRNTCGIKPSFKNNKRCQSCGYSNDTLSKILNIIHPGNYEECFMRWPKFNNNKKCQEKLVQYNSKKGVNSNLNNL